MPRRLVIVGAGGHGREMLDVVEAINSRGHRWDFVGFVADGEQFPERAEARGARILGRVDLLSSLDAAYAIGIGAPSVRARIDDFATALGCEAAVLVHPTAVLGSRVLLEPGCCIAANAVLTTNIHLGRHTHVNIAASVSHDTEIGRWCMIGPGARVAGWVRIEDGVEVGIGAVLRDRVRVESWATVGAGAAVVRDVPPRTAVAGVPAEPLSGSDLDS